MNTATLPVDLSAKFASVQQFFSQYWWLLLIVALWTIVWKGLALWRAARNGSKPWFILLLILNTVGILEIIYYFGFGNKKQS